MNWDGFLLQQSCKSWNNWVNHLKYFFKYTINIQRVFVISCLVHAQVLGECTQTFLLTAQILSHSIITTDLEDPFNKTTVLSHVVLIKTSDCTASKCSICSIQLKIFFLFYKNLSLTIDIFTWDTINCFRPSTVIPLLSTPLTVGNRGSSLLLHNQHIR